MKAILYLDGIDYEITFDGNGQITSFRYLEYEHKKLEQANYYKGEASLG